MSQTVAITNFTYVDEAYPTSKFGSTAVGIFGRSPTKAPKKKRLLLSVDVSAYYGRTVLIGTRLRLYVNAYTGAAYTARVYRLYQGCTEATVTWDTQEAEQGSPSPHTFTTPTATGWLTISGANFQALVQYALDNSITLNLGIRSNAETETAQDTSVDSDDGTNPPELVLCLVEEGSLALAGNGTLTPTAIKTPRQFLMRYFGPAAAPAKIQVNDLTELMRAGTPGKTTYSLGDGLNNCHGGAYDPVTGKAFLALRMSLTSPITSYRLIRLDPTDGTYDTYTAPAGDNYGEACCVAGDYVYVVHGEAIENPNILLDRFDADEATLGATRTQYTYNIAAYTTGQDADRSVADAAGNTRRSQSFQVAVAQEVRSAQLYLKKGGSGTVPSDWIAEIRTDDGSGKPSATILGTSVARQGMTGASYTWVGFWFTIPVSLSADTTYHLVLRRQLDATGTTYQVWGVDTSTGYALGKHGVYGGANWTVSDSEDALFGLGPQRGNSISTDGTYLYIGTRDSHVAVVRISDMTLRAVKSLTGIQGIVHCIRYSHASGNDRIFYCTKAEGTVFKLTYNVSTDALTENAYQDSGQTLTDDFAVTADYLYLGYEGSPTWNGYICKMAKSDLSIVDRILVHESLENPQSYGVFETPDGDYVWTVWNFTELGMARIKVSDSSIQRVWFDRANDEINTNEVIFCGSEDLALITCWLTTPLPVIKLTDLFAQETIEAGSGDAYSYWWPLKVYVEEPPDEDMGTFAAFTDGVNGLGTGVSLVGNVATGYTEPTGTPGESGDVLNPTNYPSLAGAVADAFDWTSGSPKAISGTLAKQASYRASDTSTADAATTLTLDKPAGLAVGDALAAFVAARSAAGAGAITPPAGWTEAAQLASNDAKMYGAIFTKEADADDVAAATFDFTTVAAHYWSGALWACKDADPIYSVASIGITATGTSHLSPTDVATASKRELVFYCYAVDVSATWGTIAGLTERAAVESHAPSLLVADAQLETESGPTQKEGVSSSAGYGITAYITFRRKRVIDNFLVLQMVVADTAAEGATPDESLSLYGTLSSMKPARSVSLYGDIVLGFVTGALSLSGSGTLSPASTRIRTAIAQFAGSGTLAPTGGAKRSTSVALAGAGTLAIQPKPVLGTSTLMTAQSALAITPAAIRSVAADLSGSGVTAIVPRVVRANTVDLAGSGTLEAVGQRTRMGAVALAAEGTLAPTGLRTRCGIAAFAGNSTLVCTPHYLAGGLLTLSSTGTIVIASSVSAIIEAILSMNASGGLAVVGRALRPGIFGLSGDGSLSPTGVRMRIASLGLSGDGALSLQGVRVAYGIVALSGQGTLAVMPRYLGRGAVALSSSGSIVITASVGAIIEAILSLGASGSLVTLGRALRSAAVALTGDGTLSPAGQRLRLGAAALSGTGTLSPSAVRQRLAAATLSGAGTLAVVPHYLAGGAIVLSGAGSLVTIGSIGSIIEAILSLSGSGSLAVAGRALLADSIALAGNGTLAPDGRRIRLGATALSGEGILAATGMRMRAGSLGLSGQSSLAVLGRRLVSGTISLSGLGDLDVAAYMGGVLEGTVALTAEGLLVVTGTLIRAASVSLSGNGHLEPTGLRITTGGVALSGNGSLDVGGIRLRMSSIALSGNGVLAVAGRRLALGSISLAANGNLAIAAAALFGGSAVLTAEGLLMPIGTALEIGAVNLSASGTMLIIGTSGQIIAAISLQGEAAPNIVLVGQSLPALTLAGTKTDQVLEGEVS